MASKIFTGDMPELMEIILNNLNNEFDSLYSCALVNRHWCKITIPILWQDPLSFDKNPTFISKYFSSLDNDGKDILKECGIVSDFPETIFRYETFLKVLNFSFLDIRVEEWIYYQPFNRQKNIYQLKCYIVNLLLKIFIKGGVTLSRLDLYVSDDYAEIKSEIFYLLELNVHFLSNLRVLFVEVLSTPYTERAITLLKILAKNATKITELKIDSYYFGYNIQLYHVFISIIKSQERLRWFNFLGVDETSTEFHGVILALESQKKGLKEILIDYCSYNAEFKVLKDCENLEVVRISYCENEEKILKSLNINNCNISTFEISSYYSIDASNIIQILEKSGSLLQRLKLNSLGQEIYSQSLLLETLMTFCPNINYLYISSIKLCTQFIKFISNLQRLQFLTLSWTGCESKQATKAYIMRLAEIFPQTLQYLDLRNILLDSNIDILLNHCDAPLKKLLFDYDHNYEEKIDAIIKFCIRKKTLNGVNVIGCMDGMFAKRFENSNVSNFCWNRIKKDLEGYVKLVPYESIVVDIL